MISAILLDADMLDAADARGAVGQAARLALRRCNKVLQRPDRKARRDHHHKRRVGQMDDGRECAQRVEIGTRLYMRSDRQNAVGRVQERISVGSTARDNSRTDGACGAWPVLDDDRLPQLRAELLGQLAGAQVRRASSRERDHDLDRLDRIVRGPGLNSVQEGAGQQQR